MYVQDSNLERFIADRLRDGRLSLLADGYPGADRRLERRYSFSDRAWMHTVYPLSSNRRSVRLLDISRSGLRIDAVLPELQSASIRVQLRDVFVIGEVRYCREAGEKYHIGVRVETVLYALPEGALIANVEDGRIHRPV